MKDTKILDEISEQIEKKVKALNEQGIQQTNIDYLGKLLDGQKDILKIKGMEDKNMRYMTGRGDDMRYSTGTPDRFDRYSGGRRRDSQGRYMGNMRYRGDDMIEDLHESYGNYMEGKQYGRYGSPEIDKAFDYMLESAEDFFNHLFEESDSPEQMEKIRKVARRISEKRM